MVGSSSAKQRLIDTIFRQKQKEYSCGKRYQKTRQQQCDNCRKSMGLPNPFQTKKIEIDFHDESNWKSDRVFVL